MGGLMRACRPGPDFNTPPANSDLNWPQSESDCFQLSVRFGRRVFSDLRRSRYPQPGEYSAPRTGAWPPSLDLCFKAIESPRSPRGPWQSG